MIQSFDVMQPELLKASLYKPSIKQANEEYIFWYVMPLTHVPAFYRSHNGDVAMDCCYK
jgi:hypothetical protein